MVVAPVLFWFSIAGKATCLHAALFRRYINKRQEKSVLNLKWKYNYVYFGKDTCS